MDIVAFHCSIGPSISLTDGTVENALSRPERAQGELTGVLVRKASPTETIVE